MSVTQADLVKAQELAIAGVLSASSSFKRASIRRLMEICNGCGPAGKFDFVPDSILGLDIVAACCIHDNDYQDGRTIEDKDEADRTWRNNMLRLIERKGGWLKTPRRLIAQGYYLAVNWWGGVAFWAGKSV